MIEIKAAPFTFPWNPGKSALLIIDMQRDFLEPGGFGESLGNDVSLLQACVPPLVQFLSAWRSWGLKVIHTQEAHLTDLSDCPPSKRNRGNPSLRIGDNGPMGKLLIAGEKGTAFISELEPTPLELVIQKPGKGAFYSTGLQEVLDSQGITQLIMAGVTTEVCVQTTMREANDRGYDCLLLEDCTASYFPEFKASTLEMIRAQGGIVGWTAPSSTILKSGEALFGKP